MDVKLKKHGTEGELVLTGRLQVGTVEEAEPLFLQVAEMFQDLTLNMQNLEYISSAGLRVINKLYKKVNGKGGKLRVINVSDSVSEVLELTGFATFLKED